MWELIGGSESFEKLLDVLKRKLTEEISETLKEKQELIISNF